MSSRIAQKARAGEARLAAERAAAAQAGRRRRLATLGAVVLLAALVVFAAAVLSRSQTSRRVSDAARISMLAGIPQREEWLGAGDAPVVVEEYADLQCPFCADFATRDLPSLVSDYVRPGRVRMRLRLLTFLGAGSVEAGHVAAAAGLQDREWDFVEGFYARQGEENSGYVTAGFLRDVAATAGGLDLGRALAQRRDRRAEAQLHAARAAAGTAGVRSTPSFRVGRRGGAMRTVGADGLRAAIDAALGR
jgi:protein-disulfide isomerase